MEQEIKKIDISKLVLWTENPRDPILSSATDQDIANKAWEDRKGKWELNKLTKEMQTHYDFSELPTVVIEDDKPIVYDGNRRMILAKLYHNLVELDGFNKDKLPLIPKMIPCNVCSKQIAIKNIYRKHASSGTWSPLERDIFVHNYMGDEKSNFLKMDEATNLISNNSHLNQRFVRDEIFKEGKLKEMGFDFDKSGNLISQHSKLDSEKILQDISQKVLNKIITTRKNRGKIIDILEKESREIIEKDKSKKFNSLKLSAPKTDKKEKKQKRKPKRTKKKIELFGQTLTLKTGDVANLYRDLIVLNDFYLKNKKELSDSFPSLIRMSLRLLAETAAKGLGKDLKRYLESNFDAAKKNLNSDIKTTLHTQNIKKGTIVNLLHIGAHSYSTANNFEQTLGISYILGEILLIDYGRK